jgi:hypothetical protein
LHNNAEKAQFPPRPLESPFPGRTTQIIHRRTRFDSLGSSPHFVRALIPKYDEKITTSEVTQNVKAGVIPSASTNGTPLPGTRSTGLPKETPAKEKHGATLLQSTEETNKAAAPP